MKRKNSVLHLMHGLTLSRKMTLLGLLLILCLGQSSTLFAQSVQASLVRIIDTSHFSPSSPDPSDIGYIDFSGRLLIADSEVDEMTIFTGANLYEMTLAGVLTRTSTTIPLTYEPTGLAYNPANRYLYISSDDNVAFFEVKPGPDGVHFTSDDVIRSFDTRLFGCIDPEDLAFDTWRGVLLIADGTDDKIFRVSPGPNGIFDGVPPAGDDQATSFSTASFGILDPSGVAFNPGNGNMFVGGTPFNWVAEVTPEGILVRMIDISEANPLFLDGLGFAPSSTDPSKMNLYVVDRGVDNGENPFENDGKVYEMSIPPLPGINQAPDGVIDTPPANVTINVGGSVQFGGSVVIRTATSL